MDEITVVCIPIGRNKLPQIFLCILGPGNEHRLAARFHRFVGGMLGHYRCRILQGHHRQNSSGTVHAGFRTHKLAPNIQSVQFLGDILDDQSFAVPAGNFHTSSDIARKLRSIKTGIGKGELPAILPYIVRPGNEGCGFALHHSFARGIFGNFGNTVGGRFRRIDVHCDLDIHSAQSLRPHGNKDLEFTVGGGLARQAQCGAAGYLQPHTRNTAVVDLRFQDLIVGIAVNDKVFGFTHGSVEGIFLLRCPGRLNQGGQKRC